MHQGIHDAHGELIDAVKDVTKDGYDPYPITVVSVTSEIGGQMVVFDNKHFTATEAVSRLRLAADFLETQINET